MKIGRIFGIDIRLHVTWWFIFVLLTWSLASGFFPQYFAGLSSMTYWLMGGIAAVLLFVSVLLHELSHSLVAKLWNIPVEGITLFFFGGVASIPDEEMQPKTEFFMSLAGPLFSLLLSGIFFGIHSLMGGFWQAILFYLYQINLMLAAFNLLPGFPLDGGRAFRAVLFGITNDLRKATKVATMVGKAIAGVLVLLGFTGIFRGGSGFWLILIGGFLYLMANGSYEQLLVRQILQGIPVLQLLRRIPAVPGRWTFRQLRQKFQHKADDIFLVRGKKNRGILDLSEMEWVRGREEKLRLEHLVRPCKSVARTSSAYDAFRTLSKEDCHSVAVMDKRKYLGVVTQEAIQRCLAWKRQKA